MIKCKNWDDQHDLKKKKYYFFWFTLDDQSDLSDQTIQGDCNECDQNNQHFQTY